MFDQRSPEYQVLRPGGEYDLFALSGAYFVRCVNSYDRGTLRFIDGDMVSNALQGWLVSL